MPPFRSDLRQLAPWLAVGLAGALLAAWAFPRAFPFFPEDWEVTPSEARAIGLEHLRELAALEEGEDAWPGDPWVAVDRISGNGLIEGRLQAEAERLGVESLRASELGRRIFQWRVTVYPDSAFPGEWSYRAEVAPDGTVTALRRRIDPEIALPPIDGATAVDRANALLRRRGHDLAGYAEPEARAQQLRERTDLVIRYRSLEAALGEEAPYGLEVHFAGDRLTGYDTFFEDPDERPLQDALQPIGLWDQLAFLSIFLAAAIVALVFLRRYHAGEVGVRRGLHLFAVSMTAGVLFVALVARPLTEGQNWGIFTRQQLPWMWGLQMVVIFVFTHSLVTFLSWSVGESLSRERWGWKLAGFDSVYQGDWDNATAARAALRGLCAGLGLLGALVAAAYALRPLGVWAPLGMHLAEIRIGGPLPMLSVLASSTLIVGSREFFGRFFLLPYAMSKLGRWPGLVATVLFSGLLLFPHLIVVPLAWGLGLALAMAAALVALMFVYDLMTVLLASFVVQVGLPALALIAAESPSLELQGWLLFAVAALPAAVTVRHLGSGREFTYRWDDVPPHVRRIAERERQRVELETARRIQSSILPDLPPRLAGVDVAHAYLPATEVGGDFYDVLALEDGRLVFALGDVAGHGVSSGLVMAAAKSALAVQVTFDPAVPAVFETLNRLVYQSARRRLIATLCYALLDPAKRELLYASAGHLYPYVVSRDGRVRDIRSTAYPLGVRKDLEVRMVRESLAPGDAVVMLSDGVVEARPEGSAELYGFERLEANLARLAGEPVEAMRDGILADVARYSRQAPREDDQTLLVLRLP